MLGSILTRDSRMRRHHADGEGGRNTVFPFFILMLSPYALTEIRDVLKIVLCYQ